MPHDSLIKIYNAIALPHFDYCSSLWDSCGKGLKDKLQKLQNRASQIITCSGYEIRSVDMLVQLGWQKPEGHWLANKATLMCKITHNLAPSYLSDKFSTRDTVHGYNTRGNLINLSIPNFLKSSVVYRGATCSNSLPEDLKASPNIDLFKKKISSQNL